MLVNYMPATGIEIIDVIQEIGNLLQDKLVDVRPDRKNPRWIFPKFPESDDNYPEVVVKLNSINFEKAAGGAYLYSETDINGNYIEYYWKWGTSILQLFALTEKLTKYSVSFDDGTQNYLYDETLNMYLIHQIKNVMDTNRDILLATFEKYNLDSLEPTFHNNKNSWASYLTYNIKFKDIWKKTYKAGVLISDYSLTQTTY